MRQLADETAGDEAAGEEQQNGSAEQQQQQQAGGQVFLTPGGHAHAEQDLLGGFTPQVRPQPWRLGGGCAHVVMYFTALSTPHLALLYSHLVTSPPSLADRLEMLPVSGFIAFC